MPYTVRPLDASTWDAFAELVERNNGVFGGCWCLGFHGELSHTQRGAQPGRETGPGPGGPRTRRAGVRR